MKNIKFKPVILLLLFSILTLTIQAQILNKIKRKVENTVTKPSDKPTENKEPTDPIDNKEKNNTTPTTGNNETAGIKPAVETNSSEEFDFIPGSTVLYNDNFEKERNGDSPAGWITTKSAEVVAVAGLKGKWLKLESLSSNHITRSKKQSWGNNYTIEFDLLTVKKTYDPRIDFALINTGGNLVTDEAILRSGRNEVIVGLILGDDGKKTRASLYGNNDIYHPIADRMSENLSYSNIIPVHVSMCVQGKRFRFWWNEKKIFDMPAVNEQYMPNQFGFNFGSVGGSDYYVTNIRIAKDIPATKPAKPVDNNVVENNNTPENTESKTVKSTNEPATVKLQSKILNINLPFAQIMKTGENSFTFIASKEEGNSKENYFKIMLQSVNTSLKPETYNFREINQKQPLYGTKKYAEISNTQAVLFYGTAQKPYIYKFSPIIANGTMASYVDQSLARHLPAVSTNSKFVIEKVEDGKASGYFIMGIMIQGLKPVTKGDAMTETFTDGFSGELKCTFSNVPVY